MRTIWIVGAAGAALMCAVEASAAKAAPMTIAGAISTEKVVRLVSKAARCWRRHGRRYCERVRQPIGAMGTACRMVNHAGGAAVGRRVVARHGPRRSWWGQPIVASVPGHYPRCVDHGPPRVVVLSGCTQRLLNVGYRATWPADAANINPVTGTSPARPARTWNISKRRWLRR